MKKIIQKKLSVVAFLGAFALGSVMMGGSFSSAPIAHAAGLSSCSVATAMSDTVSDANPKTGETITYTLEGAPAFTASTTITVTDTLGTGLTFVSETPSVGTYSSSTGTWSVGTLNGASFISLAITATVNANATGTIVNTPSINYVQSNCTQSSAAGSATITIQAAPVIVTPTSTPTSTIPSTADLSISKTADVTSTIEGGTVNYTVTVTNLSSSTTSTDVVATDTLPLGLTFEDATASASTSYASSTGTWTIGELSPNSTATLDIAALVNASTTGTITNTATVSASTTDSNTANNSSSASIVVTPNAPSPCSLSASEFEADINNGTIIAGNIVLNNASGTASFTIVNGTQCTAPISLASYKMFVAPGGPQWLSVQQLIDSTSTSALSASSTTTFVVNIAPCMTQVDAFYGPVPAMPLVDNTALYNYPNVPYLLAWTWTNTPLCAVTPSADLSISKTADVTSTTEGGTVNYTVAVKDLGPATSTDVIATDTLPSTLTFVSATTSEGFYASSTGIWTIGDMSASSTATLTIAAKVNTGTASSTITNTASVAESASTTDPNLANNSSSVSVAVAPNVCTVNCGGGSTNADIAIAKIADVTSTVEGGTVHYAITVTANGPLPSTNVVATDTLPLGLTFENATASASTSYASSTGTWTIGTLGPNATATLDIEATVNPSASSTITNTATVSESSTLTDTNLSNNSSSVTVVVTPNVCTSDCIGGTDADLAVAKTVDNANPAVGDTVHYTVTVTDNGPAESTFVHATDQLPSGLGFVSATTSQGSYNMTTGDWNIGTISPNATATLTMAALVEPGDAGVALVNTASVASQLSSWIDGNLANNSSSVTVNVQSAGCTSNCGGGGGGGGGSVQSNIAIVKTVDDSTPATGAIIHYTLTVTDSGPSDSFGVTASDILPAGVTFDSASSSEGSYVSSTGVWTIGAIADGQSATLVITATVNAAGGTTITNTGTVSENPGIINATPGNASSSVSITVAGGNGGGGGNNSGGGGGGGEVLGASTSTGQVLGASCGLYLTSYIHPFRQSLNDPTQVKKLQTFLNMNLGLNLPVTGVYNAATIAAVNQFQVKYHIEVLAPWLPLGLPTQFTPTSYVYQTTQRWINLIMCPPLNLPVPALKVDNGE